MPWLDEYMWLTQASVPVILVLTKFDAVVSRVLVDTAHGDVMRYERARTRAHAICEDSIRRRFGKDPRDVPAETVSGTYSLSLYVRVDI